jgi:DNA replication protein DnaC
VLGAVEIFRDLSAIERLRKEFSQKYSIEDIISKSPKIHKLFAILDRLLHRAEIIQITGKSYRLKDRATKKDLTCQEEKMASL